MWGGHAYRKSDIGDTALPMPRKDIRAFVFAIIAGAIIAALVPLILFGQGASRELVLYRGGRGLLLFDIACPLMIALLGWRLVRGRSAAPVLFLLTSLLPLAISLFTSWWWMRSQPGPPTYFREQGFYIVNMLSATQHVRLFACAISASSLALSALCFAGFFATIDAKRIDERAPPPSFPVLAGCSVLAILPVFFQAYGCPRVQGPFVGVTFALSLLVAWCASKVHATAGIATECEEPRERRRTYALFVACPVTIALSLGLCDYAMLSRRLGEAYSFVSEQGWASATDKRQLLAGEGPYGPYFLLMMLHLVVALLLLVPAGVRVNAAIRGGKNLYDVRPRLIALAASVLLLSATVTACVRVGLAEHEFASRPAPTAACPPSSR
jgi:hypothetical protein